MAGSNPEIAPFPGLLHRLRRFVMTGERVSSWEDGFDHISDWLKTIYQDHPLPKEQLQKARAWADELLSTSSENVVLHGDFHHGNIIQCGNQYKVIDPKGVIGERAYDMACFIRNPLKVIIQNPHLISKRIQQFSHAFDIDEARLIKWCFVHGMLSACWRMEDNQDPKDTLAFLDLL